jgi:ABC-type glycerol-3-phosphate transport system substrate-binding protein
MKNRHLRLILFASLAILLAFYITACSPEQNDTGTNDIAQPPQQNNASINENQDTSDSTNEASPAESTLSGTLTISLGWTFQNLDTAVSRFNEIHPDVVIVQNNFDDDWERYLAQVGVQLMAGTADDIINASMLSLVDLSERGFLVDFLPLMQNDPDFVEDDFFMNVFRAFEYKGGLYTFPVFFGYEFVGVNNTLSDELIESFKQHETMSHRQMLELYFAYADTDTFFLSPNMDALAFVLNNLKTFVDYENRTANFNTDDFISLLTKIREATNPQRAADGRLGHSINWDVTGVANPEFFHRYVFMIDTHQNYRAFFPISDRELFTHHIPFVTDDGYISIHPTIQFFINSASENIDLAWEFLKFLAADEEYANIFANRSISIKREHFGRGAPEYVAMWVNHLRMNDFIIEGETQEIADNIISSMGNWNEMPMQVQHRTSINMRELINETLTSFHHGILTAEQAAEELQNRVTLYLMERG